MPRPVTLFTGQWADLPLEKVTALAKQMGYDGLELACWGNHFNVEAVAASANYCREKWAQLQDHGLTCAEVEGKRPPCDLDFPIVADGIKGMQFIETAVRSTKLGARWMKFPRRETIR